MTVSRKPQKLLKVIPIPILSVDQFKMISVGFVTALLFTAFGICPSVSALIAIVLFFLGFAQIRQLAEIRRKCDAIPLILLVIACSPLAAVDSWFSPAFLIKAVMCQLYFSAGLEKLYSIGVRWAKGEVLQSRLIEYHLWTDNPLALKVAERAWLCTLLSSLTLFMEMSFPVILFIPELELFYAGLALVFHFSTGLFMNIHYLLYFGPAFWVFLL